MRKRKKTEESSSQGIPPLPVRPRGAHKGEVGRVLVVAGSRGMLGAACLAARAAARGGAGLVTLALPKGLLLPASAKLTETILTPLAETSRGAISSSALPELFRLVGACDAAAIGPGLSRDPETQEVVSSLYAQAAMPLVVDADALNALAERRVDLARHAGRRLLTPHPGEMARLLGISTGAVQKSRLRRASGLARAAKAVVVLKGAGTVVADGRRSAVNATGNPGMATAGAGDVLTGLVAALWAQGMEAWEAARLGVHLHGLAGDLAAGHLGEHSLIAGDLVDFLPEAFRSRR